MKRRFIMLALVAVCAMSPLIYLYISYRQAGRKSSYNFVRRLPFKVTEIDRLDLKINGFYFAGESHDSIYLANKTSTDYVSVVDKKLRDRRSFFIGVDPKNLSKTGKYKTFIYNDRVYLFNGLTRSILMSDTNNVVLKPGKIFSPYFQEAVPITEKSIVFRYVSMNTGENAFVRKSLYTPPIENDTILKKQVDGRFCTAGILEYNSKLNALTYLYQFRNEIILMDTNLKLIRKVRTIDPIDSAKFKVSKIKSANMSVLTSPALVVNARCSNWKNFLFVESKLMGRNEDLVNFKHNMVLDIYNLESGRYTYSVYLPNQQEKSFEQFKVYGNKIYALSGQYLYGFSIELPY